jgi:hypothetical protein
VAFSDLDTESSYEPAIGQSGVKWHSSVSQSRRTSQKVIDWLMSIRVISKKHTPHSSLSRPFTNARALAKNRLGDESIFFALLASLGGEIGSVVSSSRISPSETDVGRCSVVKQKLVRAEQNGAATESISSVPCMEKRRACFRRRSVQSRHFAQSHFPQRRVRTCSAFSLSLRVYMRSSPQPKVNNGLSASRRAE